MILNRLPLTVLLAIVFGTGVAEAEAPAEYQSNFALDLGPGANLELSSLSQEQQSVFPGRSSVVTQIAVRPCYYFSRHWGAYADLRINLFRFHDYEKFLDMLVPGLSKLKPTFSLGAIYRYEHLRWQIQPRFGIGLVSYGGSDAHTTINGKRTEESLSEGMGCVDAGISLAYRTSRICSLFLDIDAMEPFTPAKYTSTTTVDGTVTSTRHIESHTRGRNMSISIGIRFQTSTRK